MSKKPRKSAPRAASKAASRKLAKAATKRPAAALTNGHAERIADALEAIAAQLPPPPLPLHRPSRSATRMPSSGTRMDGFPGAAVSRVDLGLLKGSTGCAIS